MVVLRRAQIADLDRLFVLDQVCFPPSIAYSRREFRSLLRSSTTIGVLAEESQVLAGFVFATVHPPKTLAHLVTLDVAPPLRRQGVGLLLVGELEASLRRAGALSIELEVARNNPGAQKFYRRVGFESIGLLEDYYPGQVDAFVMRKALL